MNMMNTMRRGLATTAMSLVCLMAGTMNTLAATDAGTELVSQIDAAAGEETNSASAEAAQTPSGPASDPELIGKQTNSAAEEAADGVHGRLQHDHAGKGLVFGGPSGRSSTGEASDGAVVIADRGAVDRRGGGKRQYRARRL